MRETFSRIISPRVFCKDDKVEWFLCRFEQNYDCIVRLCSVRNRWLDPWLLANEKAVQVSMCFQSDYKSEHQRCLRKRAAHSWWRECTAKLDQFFLS